MVDFVFRDGQRLTPKMLAIVNAVDAAFYARFRLHLLVSSGVRTYEEQKAIFLSRYTRTPDGRKVYDTRIWNGVKWYRISPAGTVAVPGTSNHEIQGTKAAVDLRDTGSDAGVTRAGTTRANWMKANAASFGMVASGYGFGEPWHYDVLNVLEASAPAGSASGSVSEGEDMGTIDNTEENYQILGKMAQRMIKFDIRPNGFGPDWKLGPTLFELLAAADDSADVAKIGASVGGEIAKVNVTLAGLATPDLNIDVDALVGELRAGLAPEIVKALGEKLVS